MAVSEFLQKYPEYNDIPVVPVSTPDYTGFLESGFAKAVEEIITAIVPKSDEVGTDSGKRPRQVNVLVGSFLTPDDLEELKDIIELFGLRPVLIPDLSDSLDRYLGNSDFSALTIGGTDVSELQNLGHSVATLAPYFKIVGWGWFYLSTILDDYSCFIVSWRLCTNMTANDGVILDDALGFTELEQVKVNHKLGLLSDNGPCYISGELADYLKSQNMTHTRGRPYHPQTQGKIERWHRSMKNQILLENYYLPNELDNALTQFVHYYNHERYHESLDNLTPADVYYGQGQKILKQRELIK